MRRMCLADLEHRQLSSQRDGELFSCSLCVTELLGFAQMQVYHELLAPQHSSSAPHAHSHKTEAFYLLSGQLKARVEEQELLVSAGEMLVFEPGEQHQLYNPGPEVTQYLIFAEELEQDRVIYSSKKP